MEDKAHTDVTACGKMLNVISTGYLALALKRNSFKDIIAAVVLLLSASCVVLSPEYVVSKVPFSLIVTPSEVYRFWVYLFVYLSQFPTPTRRFHTT